MAAACFPGRCTVPVPPGLRSAPERHEQAAEQDGVRQRFRDRGELRAVLVERGERSPERRVRTPMQFLGYRLEQAGVEQTAERSLGRP